MELNEIKKALDEENTRATFVQVSKEGIFYVAIIGKTYADRLGLNFLIPLEQLEYGTYAATVKALHISEWIIKPKES